MTFPDLMKRGLAVGLAAQLVLATQLATEARAEMISTDTAISKYTARADRDFLLSEVKRQEIREEIIALGVDPAEAEARLAALSDAEIASIVSQMDEDSAGSGIVGALLTVFIILLVTDLLCLTRVFNFTRCAR